MNKDKSYFVISEMKIFNKQSDQIIVTLKYLLGIKQANISWTYQEKICELYTI